MRLLISLLLLGGCTNSYMEAWPMTGETVEFVTFENGFAPNVTLVRGNFDGTPGDDVLAFQGAASMNQAWTMGAGTAAAGYFIGSGIKEQAPDNHRTSVNQQGSRAYADGGEANARALGGSATSVAYSRAAAGNGWKY